MCAECEKSLPNQIVFDKIEAIIRLMQDENNGLPVKTAKSFMSKIPSVFTGTDLVQWMMRNLKLDDQQEAVHLANLIASHGYIFPIEDHTLSIKNDCTFYRFQTPCLWPSNNNDPENTDYAVYLCKRTMQGKAWLELADYEAENLARLQKMFSRKWEFIFMQAESQAKVDKKRDKLERKVLDSQERAFWDVYRPVPGCVNTTELDIKKACRLSKSAKRCAECQKVMAAASGSGASSPAPPIAPIPAPEAPAKALQTVDEPGEPQVAPAGPQQVEPGLVAGSESSGVEGRLASASEPPTLGEPSKAEAPGPRETHLSTGEPENLKSKQEPDTPPKGSPMEVAAPEPEPGAEQQQAAAASERANEPVAHGQAQPAAVSSASSTGAQKVSQPHAHAHQHSHAHAHMHPHHHHHHHHHHHPHQHAHHHHHHQHRQCPHHKHLQQQQQQAQAKRESQLSLPAESILTTTLAAGAAEQLTPKSSPMAVDEQLVPESEQQQQRERRPQQEQERKAEQPQQQQQQKSGQRQLEAGACPKKRSIGSVDQFMSAPSAAAQAALRRKSECNRMLSINEPLQTGSRSAAGSVESRPSSACCSFTSLDRSGSEVRTGTGAGTDTGTGAQGQVQAHSHPHGSSPAIQRKSSLNIMRDDRSQSGSRSISTQASSGESQPRKSSVQALHQLHQQQQQHQFATRPTGQQHSQLKGARSVCSSGWSSAGHSELPGERQNIDDLERELEALKVRLDRRIGGVKMSKVTQSYLSYFKQWAEYDPFIAQPIPSNPWISDSTELWDSERQTKDVHCRRVRRWAFSLKELLNDPAGREQFHRFLEKEFSAENLKFWDAVQELKRVHSRDVARRVEAIWTEYLAQDANCPINIDSKSYETSKRNMAKNRNNRYIFDEAAGHVYQLMKNDSYPRYLRSEMYKDYKEASEKKRTNQVAFDVFKPQITTLKHKFNF